jgi:hypothetical protein
MTAQKKRPAPIWANGRYAIRGMKTPVEIFVTSSEESDESMDVLQRAIAEGKFRELRINGEIVLTPTDLIRGQGLFWCLRIVSRRATHENNILRAASPHAGPCANTPDHANGRGRRMTEKSLVAQPR